MTYLVNLKRETAKGQRRAKNTSPLYPTDTSPGFPFPFLSVSPSSPLSTGQHQESQSPPPGAVLPWHLGDYLPRSQPRGSASCWGTLRSTFCARPLLVPIPWSSVPDGTGSSLTAAGRSVGVSQMAQVSLSLRHFKSSHRLTEVTSGLCPQQWPPVQVPESTPAHQNWARHPPFFPLRQQYLPWGPKGPHSKGL